MLTKAVTVCLSLPTEEGAASLLFLLFISALWAGMRNALAGGGSFVTLPALMMTGLDARAANIASTLALFPAQMTTGWVGREEVSGAAGLSFPSLTIISLGGGAVSGATVQLAAQTQRLIAEASSGATISRLGGGRIDAGDAEIRASSGASVRVCSAGRLSGRTSSGGSVTSAESGTGDRSTSFGGDFSTRRCS